MRALSFLAWKVNFNKGYVSDGGGKFFSYYVRAVRGGSPSAAFLDMTATVLD